MQGRHRHIGTILGQIHIQIKIIHPQLTMYKVLCTCWNVPVLKGLLVSCTVHENMSRVIVVAGQLIGLLIVWDLQMSMYCLLQQVKY
jgi:hypothetical protein